MPENELGADDSEDETENIVTKRKKKLRIVADEDDDQELEGGENKSDGEKEINGKDPEQKLDDENKSDGEKEINGKDPEQKLDDDVDHNKFDSEDENENIIKKRKKKTRIAADEDESDEDGDVGEVELRNKLKQSITHILDTHEIANLTINVIRKQLRKTYNRKEIKRNKTFIKGFVKEELIRRQSEKNGSESDQEPEQAYDENPEEFPGNDSPQHQIPGDYYSGDEIPRKKKEKKAKKAKTKKKKGIPVKKPRTAYICFGSENRQKIIQEHNINSRKWGEVTKKIAEVWKSMTEEDKGPYIEKSNADKERYINEVEQWKLDNPEEWRILQEEKEKTKKQKSHKDPNAPSKKRKKGEQKEKNFEEEGISYETEPVVKEDDDFLSQIIKDLRPKSRRRKKVDPLENQDLKDMAQYFIKKMEKAAQKDIDLNLKGEPAINKLMMLPEVIAQVSKLGMQEVLMGYGLLRAISFWLKPLPDKSLPNLYLRTGLYKLLNGLYIDESRLNNSAGLGKEIMNLWKCPKELPKNKAFLQIMIEKWSRPIYGLSINYKTLADDEEENAALIKKRKKDLGYIPYHRYSAKKKHRERASIPVQSAFDYAIRPKSRLEDAEKPSSSKKAPQGRKKRISKTMENITKKMLLMDHQFFAKQIDISGKTIDMGMLD